MLSTAPVETPITAAAERELVASDPALDRVISLAEHNQFIPAAEQAEQLWQQHVYDVRTLGFYLFGVFLEQGMLGLLRIAACIECTVTVNWPYVGPKDGKQHHLDMAMRWLFTNLLTHLRFHQKSAGELWQRHLQQWDLAPQQQILQSIAQVAVLLGKVLPTAVSQSHVNSLRSMLQALPTTKLSQETPVAEDGPLADASQLSAGEGDLTAATFAHERDFRIRYPSPAGELTLSPSFPLQTLIRRLAAFNQLARLGKFKQAAIIYKDIQYSIEHFDPRVYLPSLFAEYFSNIVAHSARLTESLHTKDDITAAALMELYRIDIELFMAAKT